MKCYSSVELILIQGKKVVNRERRKIGTVLPGTEWHTENVLRTVGQKKERGR